MLFIAKVIPAQENKTLTDTLGGFDKKPVWKNHFSLTCEYQIWPCDKEDRHMSVTLDYVRRQKIYVPPIGGDWRFYKKIDALIRRGVIVPYIDLDLNMTDLSTKRLQDAVRNPNVGIRFAVPVPLPQRKR